MNNYKNDGETAANQRQDGGEDSREKLEADVMEYYTHTTSTAMWPDSANIKTKWISVSMDKVCGWLDRQAAITKAECRERIEFYNNGWEKANRGWADANRRTNQLNRERVDLQEQVDGLTAERDELKAKVDDIMDEPDYREAWERMHKERDEWKTKCETREVAYKQADAERKRYSEQIDELAADLESSRAKVRSLKAHIGKMQGGRHVWHERAESLQAKVDRLERENESLARDLAECERDRDVYRMALGDARRLAHEIARIEAGDAS